MGLETGTYIGDLVSTNPAGTDPKGQGDDHLRLIKGTVKNTFPGFTKAVLVTGTDTGSANTYVLTPTPALPSLDAGTFVAFVPTNGNTGASTLNISSQGSKALKSVAGADLINGEIVVGQPVLARYDGTDFRLIATTKQYVDQLAFAATLPGQVGKAGLFLYTDGTIASWQDVLPARSTGTVKKALKSLGTAGTASATTEWDWDGFQGRQTKSGNYTIVLDDRSKWTDFTAAATVSFDDAATLGSKFITRVSNSSTSGIVTLDPDGSQTINGASTLKIAGGEVWDVISDGSNLFAECVDRLAGTVHVSIQEQSTGDSTSPTTTGTWNTRVLNTTVRNLIGATLVSNQITLPPGVYELSATAVCEGFPHAQLRIYSVTASAALAYGESVHGGAYSNVVVGGALTRVPPTVVTLTTSTTLEVQQYLTNTTSVGASTGTSVSANNVYATFQATRIGGA